MLPAPEPITLDDERLTTQQRFWIEQVRKRMLEYTATTQTCFDERYEFKAFELHWCVSFVALLVEVGRKDDEGTVGVLNRHRRHYFIGPRGGLRLVSGHLMIMMPYKPVTGRAALHPKLARVDR